MVYNNQQVSQNVCRHASIISKDGSSKSNCKCQKKKETRKSVSFKNNLLINSDFPISDKSWRMRHLLWEYVSGISQSAHPTMKALEYKRSLDITSGRMRSDAAEWQVAAVFSGRLPNFEWGRCGSSPKYNGRRGSLYATRWDSLYTLRTPTPYKHSL